MIYDFLDSTSLLYLVLELAFWFFPFLYLVGDWLLIGMIESVLLLSNSDTN